jgi:sulfate permease, SulP family
MSQLRAPAPSNDSLAPQPLPVSTWLDWGGKVNRQTVLQDAAAGLTGALIVLPQGMAYAMIAGLPPQFGLYCAMVPAVVAALLGSSWHLVSGPTAAISIVVFASLSPLAQVGSAAYVQLALTLGFMAGCVQVLLALLRAGKLTDLIPHSVIVGFTTGAACLIAASQIKSFLGISIPANLSFFNTLGHAVQALPSAQWAVCAVGAATLLATLCAKQWLKPLPHMVVGMVVGAVLAYGMNALLGRQAGIDTVGALPGALPALSSPSWDAAVWRQLTVSAVVVALLALTEAIAIARAIALRTGQAINGNQETLGQGLSNLAGAFFSAYPSSGSFTRSGVNVEAGAQTPLAAVFAAGLLLAMVLLIAPLIAYLPIAAMAGVLMLVAWGLIDRQAIARCFTNRSDGALFIVTAMGCLVLDIEWAVAAGVALAVGQSLATRYKARFL